MKIPALKFLVPSPGGSLPLRCDLTLETPRDLHRIKKKALPAAYVVRQEDIGHLRQFGDLVVDRGGKHPAKALSTLLLRYDKIPLVRGSYRSPGQLKRSVWTLLANSIKAGVRNIYFIGTEEKIFDHLWEEASPLGSLPLSLGQKGNWVGVSTKLWQRLRKRLRFLETAP
ncbi:MAG: hypothetical protein NTY64_05405 [Deltaproteobacteria bacterium]|nr:hypothetical protein [Deltaproteobacteria bacterium]